MEDKVPWPIHLPNILPASTNSPSTINFTNPAFPISAPWTSTSSSPALFSLSTAHSDGDTSHKFPTCSWLRSQDTGPASHPSHLCKFSERGVGISTDYRVGNQCKMQVNFSYIHCKLNSFGWIELLHPCSVLRLRTAASSFICLLKRKFKIFTCPPLPSGFHNPYRKMQVRALYSYFTWIHGAADAIFEVEMNV